MFETYRQSLNPKKQKSTRYEREIDYSCIAPTWHKKQKINKYIESLQPASFPDSVVLQLSNDSNLCVYLGCLYLESTILVAIR